MKVWILVFVSIFLYCSTAYSFDRRNETATWDPSGTSSHNSNPFDCSNPRPTDPIGETIWDSACSNQDSDDFDQYGVQDQIPYIDQDNDYIKPD